MIHIESLYFSYTGRAPYILDGVDLDIGDGEYVSVLGDNGSGKSTLMRLILRFLKPSRGVIRCDAKRVGYVPQKNDYSNGAFPITVDEALNSYRHLLKIRDRDAVERALALVGMEPFRKALMGTLSGGQSQKIQIARALMGDPDLLILDEPSTGVDIGSQREIYGFLTRINREKKITVVSVEHNLEAAVTSSTLIYHLSQGHGHLCTPEKYTEEFLRPGGRSGERA